MAIWVTSLTRAPAMAELKKPERILSLLSPGDVFPIFETHSDDRHIRIAVDDVMHDNAYADSDLVTAPSEIHARSVIDFAETWSGEGCLLIHCWAGISRSSASAFITACVRNPRTDEGEIADAIRRASRVAKPNPLLVRHADRILNRGGRMIEAVESMSPWEFAPENTPFVIPSRYPDKGGHV